THRSIIFCDDAHERAYCKSYSDCSHYTPFSEPNTTKLHSFRKDKINKTGCSSRCKDNGTPVTHIKRLLHIIGIDTCGVAYANEPGSYNRKEDTHTSDK